MNKFFQFLKGYVIIEIYGRQYARFINICLRRGIRIYAVSPQKDGAVLKIASCDFKNVRPIASKCRVKVRIKRKRGLLYKSRLYRKRYAFAAAALVCAVLCFISTRFIWLVEINGVRVNDIEKITETLDEMGVKRGALKGRLPEGMEMKRRLMSGEADIAWAWVYIEGAKARVEIYEQTVPPSVVDKKEPCDIIAACDGVIKSMIVKGGEELRGTGEAVSAGDIIVSGRVPVYREGYQEEYISVHSIAEVNAYTTHIKSGEYKLLREFRIPTGKRKVSVTLDIFGKAVPLPHSKINYEEFDMKETRHELDIPLFGYSGLAIDLISYDEVALEYESIPVETVVELAKNDMEEKISKELTPGSALLGENIEYEQLDSETIKATLKMDFIQNIAVSAPMDTGDKEGEEILDNETNRNS